jgi:hypothetical protein
VLASAGGNYNDANLSVGNVRPVAFGLSQTGDLSNLVATDAAYVTLENSRNNDNGTVAADIATGKSVKIRNVTTNGSLVAKDLTYAEEAARNTVSAANVDPASGAYLHLGVSTNGTLDVPALSSVDPLDTLRGAAGTMDVPAITKVLKSDTLRGVAGSWDDDNLGVGSENNVRNGKAYGLSQTGTLSGGGGNIPGTPSGLSVTSTSDTVLTIAWAFDADAAYFKVYRATTSGGSFSLVGTVTALSFADSGLTADTTYFYKVKAGNDAGESAFSAEVYGTTLTAVSVPTETIISQLAAAIKAAVDEIPSVESANVVIGEVEDIDSRTSTGFPLIEIVPAGTTGTGEVYESQRSITSDYAFGIYVSTYATTPARVSGTDLTDIDKYASAVIRQIYRFMDAAQGGNPPCTGFLMVNPNYRRTPNYQIFSEHVNSEVIEISFKVYTEDILL